MANPAFSSAAAIAATTVNATSWSPIGAGDFSVPAGGMVVANVSADGSPTLTAVSSPGWSKLGQATDATNSVTGAVFAHANLTVSSESVPALSINSSASEEFSAVYTIITDANAIKGTSSSGNSADSDPPIVTTTKAWLALASRSGDGATQPSAAPTGFTFAAQSDGGFSAASTYVAYNAGASAGTVDPSQFPVLTEQWVCWTVWAYANPVLGAAQGSVSLTGRAATLRINRRVVAAQAAFALAGQAASGRVTRKLVAAAGSISLSGQAATLKPARRLVASTGTFTLAGQAAGLRVPGKIFAEPGVFALAGRSAALTLGRRLTAAPASFTLSGQPASFTKGPRLSAAQGTVALAGREASFRLTWHMAAGLGSVAINGQASAMLRSRRMAAAAGSVALTGSPANMHVVHHVAVVTPPGRILAVPESGLAGRTLAIPASRLSGRILDI